MLYRIFGRGSVFTHRHVELSNWDAPDIATAKQSAAEIGIVVSKIEPMNAGCKKPVQNTSGCATSSGTGRFVTGTSWKAFEAESP